MTLLKRLTTRTARLAAIVAAAALSASCINEDLSDCPEDATVELTYRLHLAEDGDFLGGQSIDALHLGFWEAGGPLWAEQVVEGTDIPDDMTFRLAMPRRDFAHVAMLNCGDPADGSHTAMPQGIGDVLLTQHQSRRDTVEAMEAPAYTGTLDLPLSALPAGGTATFDVLLEPRVARLMLNVKYEDGLSNIRCYVDGTAGGYYPRTGQWLDAPGLVVDANATAALVGDDEMYYWFYAYPTQTDGGTRATAQQGAEDDSWHVYLYATMPDGTVTQYDFTVTGRPTVAGEVFRAIFVLTDGNGWSNIGAGVEIDTNWRPGIDIDIEM